MAGGTEPTGLDGSHVHQSLWTSSTRRLANLLPRVETGDSRRGNMHVVSTSQALWTKMLFCPFSMHEDVSVPNY